MYNKIVLKAEDDVLKGRFEEACAELLWSYTITAFWDTQFGVRNDAGFGRPIHSWAAFGVQGLVPYWFDIETAAYVGNSGCTALRLPSEYELLLIQWPILQPCVETNFYGKCGPDLAVGNGLSSVTIGLRLCYGFSHQFAPYIGVERSQAFSGIANMVEATGEHRGDTYSVTDMRLWF